MKGIIIYGNPLWGDNERATYCELINEASFDVTQYAPKTIISSLKGETSKLSKTVCSKDDTYDFETGALIALMKMCGLEKSAKAYAEIFDDTAYGDALKERDRLDRRLREAKEVINTKARFIKEKNEEIEKLKEEKEQIIVAKSILNNKLIEENSNLNYIKSCNESTIKSLENTRDLLINKNNELIEENEKLKSDKDKSWKNYQRNIQKKQDRINELERAYKASNDDEAKLVEYYQREIKKFEEEIKNLKGNIDELFESDKYSKSLVGKLSFEKHRLEEENEKLQHGYIDTDNVPSGHWDGDILDIVFLPGRACGKQYKALVDLFKKIDQKKVDAAYKEAYNTTLPVWQKEVLNQMYGIYKESKEKTELPRTLDINGTVYRKSIQIKDFGEQINKLTVDSLVEQSRAFTRKCVDEWLYKIPTKREEMWDEILKEGRTPVYVKRENVHDFLKECQVMGIKWATGKMPLETTPFHMCEGYDGIYFFVMTSLDISKSTSGSKEFRHVMCWWMTASDEEARNSIKYLPPMRWDLFKNGRLAVKVTYKNYKEFYEACEKELGKKPSTYLWDNVTITISICKKDGNFEIFTIEHQKKTGRKIVDWEDVR